MWSKVFWSQGDDLEQEYQRNAKYITEIRDQGDVLIIFIILLIVPLVAIVDNHVKVHNGGDFDPDPSS